MIVIMRPDAIPEQIAAVRQRIEDEGLESTVSQGVNKAVIGLIGKRPPGMLERVQVLPGVEMVIPVDKPYKFAARGEGGDDTHIRVGNVTIGSNEIAVIGGPCSVESEEQIVATAEAVKEAGGHILRGGAFKPRSSPYSFQGKGREGLELLRTAANATGLPLITEVMEPGKVPLVAEYVDILQIGTRNMQNFPLLQAVGNTDKPVLLKRGMAATIEDLLMSAEYIMAAGNMRVILCERGIRTFETATRNTLDLSAIPVIKEQSHLPVIIDPQSCHGYVGTGKADVASCCRRGSRRRDDRGAPTSGAGAFRRAAERHTGTFLRHHGCHPKSGSRGRSGSARRHSRDGSGHSVTRTRLFAWEEKRERLGADDSGGRSGGSATRGLSRASR